MIRPDPPRRLHSRLRGSDCFRPAGWIVPLLLVAATAGADMLGMFAGIDSYFHDMAFRLRGPRPVSDRIVVVAVDDASLQRLGRWPLPRHVYAEALERVALADAVGFDILFQEPAPGDGEFAAAISRHGRVVLPAFIDRRLQVTRPLPALRPAAVGHIHVEQGVDSIAREIYHLVGSGGPGLPSLSSALHGTASGSPPAPAAAPAPSRGIVQSGRALLNYYGPAGTFPRVSLAEVAEGKYPPGFFRDRIVLFGITAAGVADEYSTPFSQFRNRTPGVEIHATSLANILDGSALREASPALRRGAAGILAVLLYLFCAVAAESAAVLAWLGFAAAVPLVCYAFFRAADIALQPALFLASATAAFLFAYLQRLDTAARRLDREHAEVSSLLGEPVPQDKPSPGLLGYLHEGGIDSRINRLVAVEQSYGHKLEELVRVRTDELSRALEMVNGVSNELILRLTRAAESRDDVTGEHILRIRLYMEELGAALGLPAAETEELSYASIMHDIGKIGIPDRILLKPGPLNGEEMGVMMTHTSLGEGILRDSPYPRIRTAAEIALNHHERWDGSGYPNARKGTDIPLSARMVMLCDCYDALRSRRPYKEPYTPESTVRMITEGTDDGRLRPEFFDPSLLEEFRNLAPLFHRIFARHSIGTKETA